MAKHKPTKNQRELFTDVWQRFIVILATEKVPGYSGQFLLDENDWSEKQFSKRVRKVDPKLRTEALCKKVHSRLRELHPKAWEKYLERKLGAVLEWEKLCNDQWPRQGYERSRDWENAFGDDMRLFIGDHVLGLAVFEGEEKDVVYHIIKCWQLALAATRRHFRIPPSMPEALAEAPVTKDGSEKQGAEKPAHDPRNLVEQRNNIIAKAYNEAKENKAAMAAAAVDRFAWIVKNDDLLIKWHELSFAGALKNRPSTVRPLFSTIANRYR